MRASELSQRIRIYVTAYIELHSHYDFTIQITLSVTHSLALGTKPVIMASVASLHIRKDCLVIQLPMHVL